MRTIRQEWEFVGPGQYNPKARELADRFGIHPSTAYNIAIGKSWKHVKEAA